MISETEIKRIAEKVEQSDDRWHLDKKVPIAIILALLVQTVGFAWYMGNLDNRVTVLEAFSVGNAERSDRLVRLETQFASVKDTLLDMNKKLDRLVERETKNAPP